MQIRPLTTIDECRQVAALERAIWAYDDAEDVVPPPVLIVSAMRGGILLGAFEESGQLVGFSYSLPAVKDGRLTQWSHMTGVVPERQGSGLGLRLKLAQREAAMAMGIDLIEWTFDPLQAMNAHFNFARLGTVVEEYEENIYGDSSSVLHRGTPTDRFVAEWRLDAPHVIRRIQSHGLPTVRDANVASAPLVNRTHAGRWLEPGIADLSLDGRRLLVEIPMGFSEMLVEDPTLAREWRQETRVIFQHYLARGYRVVDFFLAREARRGQYLLALTEASNPN